MPISLLQSFPEKYTPNSSQVKLLNNIEKAFSEGYKFVVCCAPTGSGKSFISKTLSNVTRSPSEKFTDLITSYAAFKHTHTGSYANEDECGDEKPFGAVALTITKALQDQYKELFSEVNVLKGKSNYQCNVDDRFSVETAPCVFLKSLKEDCWKKNTCPYYNARNDALLATFATLNYNMFFALPSHVKQKEYLICDEASELEDQLVKQFTCTVNFDILKKCNINIQPFDSKNYDKASRWVNNLLCGVSEQLEELKDIVTNNKAKKAKSYIDERKKELVTLRGLHSKLSTLLDTWEDCEYLFETDRNCISFVPLKVDNLAKYLFKHGQKIILMSATIIDHKNFCKTLGIDKYKYVEVDSSFDPKNAPIFVNTKVKLSYNNLQQNLPKIKKQIQEICDFHKNEKGLIHTHTNTITQYLQKNIFDQRFLYREPGIQNSDILTQHFNTSEPTVLVSPSMSFGVDLKGDLAKFQIIIKAPYLPMKDKRIERLMKVDSSWYMNKMLCSLIQSCGRGVRSTNDQCITYILDGAIIEQVLKNRNKLPKYFLERFV
jgi:Rad3-related DNA helicase